MTCSNTVYYHTDEGTVILSRFYGRIVDETQRGSTRIVPAENNFLAEMLNDLEITNRGISSSKSHGIPPH
jgi:hypothetical protein